MLNYVRLVFFHNIKDIICFYIFIMIHIVISMFHLLHQQKCKSVYNCLRKYWFSIFLHHFRHNLILSSMIRWQAKGQQRDCNNIMVNLVNKTICKGPFRSSRNFKSRNSTHLIQIFVFDVLNSLFDIFVQIIGSI